MSDQVSAAADILSSGGIIGYPTETVYGLGCLPESIPAVTKLIKLKQRSAGKGFILLAASVAQLKPYTAGLTPNEWRRIASPGDRATTWTVPAATNINPLLTGEHRQIAIRITRHELVQRLCTICKSPLISTSANLSGEPPVRQADELPESLRRQIDLIVSGPCGAERRPSRIVDLKTGKILRD